MRLLLGGVLVLTPFVSVPPGPDKMLEYGLYQNEQILAACAVNEGKAGHAVYDTTVIIDMDHGSLGKMRKAPKEFLNKYIQPLNDYYPETMFKTIVVNAPTWMKVSPPPLPLPPSNFQAQPTYQLDHPPERISRCPSRPAQLVADQQPFGITAHT